MAPGCKSEKSEDGARLSVAAADAGLVVVAELGDDVAGVVEDPYK